MLGSRQRAPPARTRHRAGQLERESRGRQEAMASSYERTGTPGIFKRGDSFSVAYRHPITRKTTFQTAGKTLREAKTLKRTLEAQRERGQSSPDGQLTFAELWTAFEQQHISTLSPSTAADYHSVSRRYLLPRYRLARVGDIDTAEVLRYREELLRTKSATTGRTLSPKRVRNILLVLASAYSFGVATNRAWSNPVHGLRRVGRSQPSETRAAFLTQEEVAREFNMSTAGVKKRLLQFRKSLPKMEEEI